MPKRAGRPKRKDASGKAPGKAKGKKKGRREAVEQPPKAAASEAPAPPRQAEGSAPRAAPKKRKKRKRAGVAESSGAAAAAAARSATAAAGLEPTAPAAAGAAKAATGKKGRRKAAGAGDGAASELGSGGGGASSSTASATCSWAPAVAPGAAGWQALEPWLRAGGACFEAVEVRHDAGSGGVGAFARRAIAAGEVAFTVPTQLLLTADAASQDSAVSRVRDLLKEWSERERPELLLSLRLCRALQHPEDMFHAYARSLPEAAPGAAAWPKEFRDFLASTSLGASLKAADQELDEWCALLKKVAASEPRLLKPEAAYGQAKLLWARGMLRSRHFPGAFSGVPGRESELCMVPLLDILNRKPSAEVSVRVKAQSLEFVCDEEVKAGQQVWNKHGAKGNDELLMCYGFAVDSNPCDAVKMPLAPGADGVASLATLTPDGVSQELIDSIEEEQNTERFVGLLRGTMVRKRAAKACLDQLPRALNFNVCKGPVNRARKRSIESFLEGELRILEASLECMRTSEQDREGSEEEGGGDDGMEDEDGPDDARLQEMFRKQKKRRRR